MTEEITWQARKREWQGYAVTVLLEVVVTAGLLLLEPVFPLGKFPIPYVLVTMIAAYFYGGGPAIVAGIIGWLAFTSLFVTPRGLAWPIASSPEGWAREMAFFLGVTVVAIAAVQVKKAHRSIQRLAEESVALNQSLSEEITERKHAEEALREQARMLDLTHVLVRDMDDRITFWNTGAEVLYGYTRGEAVGMISHELFRTVFPAPLETINSELLETGEWEGELVHQTKYGRQLTVASHWVLHRDRDGNPSAVIETNNDVTDLKSAERELKKLTAELEDRVDERTHELRASNKELETAYKEMQTLSYSIMHDLRTPLRAIGGFSNALSKHYMSSLDSRGQDYLQRIGAATRKMSRIIDDIHELLRAARVDVHRQDTDMSDMAGKILSEFRKSQPERKAEISIQPDLVVRADPDLLRVALNNMLGNAWKFASKREVTRIEFGSIEQNGSRVYLIRDNGTGFNPAYADKLFAPFQRLHTENEFPGTGIGLALVERILRRHGGRIWAESDVGKGATFYFTLGEADV